MMHFQIILPQVYFKNWGLEKTSIWKVLTWDNWVLCNVNHYTPDKEYSINPLLTRGLTFSK